MRISLAFNKLQAQKRHLLLRLGASERRAVNFLSHRRPNRLEASWILAVLPFLLFGPARLRSILFQWPATLWSRLPLVPQRPSTIMDRPPSLGIMLEIYLSPTQHQPVLIAILWWGTGVDLRVSQSLIYMDSLPCLGKFRCLNNLWGVASRNTKLYLNHPQVQFLIFRIRKVFTTVRHPIMCNRTSSLDKCIQRKMASKAMPLHPTNLPLLKVF